MELNDFNPNGTGVDNGNYFGLPFKPDDSALVLLSVPWDVTSSYGDGSAYAPDAIIGASIQLDLYDPIAPGEWQRGIGTIPIDYTTQESSALRREDAKKIIKHLENGGSIEDSSVKWRIDKVNEASELMNVRVYNSSVEWLAKDKIIGLLGGDHSTPYGFIYALGEKYRDLSILHIDAHADLREEYEGFTYSHASIMHNVMTKVPGVRKLVQIGVRDQCDCEAEMVAKDDRIEQFGDYALASNAFKGMTWDAQCEEIVSRLGDNVYVSFDIDGLTPENALNTGTPVPGGLSFNKAVYLIDKLTQTGRRIVGFDLCEVSPKPNNEWDANVGARILFKLCNLTLKSNK